MFEVRLIESLPSRRVGHAKYCSTRDARHRSNTSPPLSEDSSVASQNRPFTDIMRESFVGVQRKRGKTYKNQRETKNANHTCPFNNPFRHIMSSIVAALSFIRSPFTVTIEYLGRFSGSATSSNNSAENWARADESQRADRPGESIGATDLASQTSWRTRGKKPATTDGAFTLEEQVWEMTSSHEPSIVEAAKTWLIDNARGAFSEADTTSSFTRWETGITRSSQKTVQQGAAAQVTMG